GPLPPEGPDRRRSGSPATGDPPPAAGGWDDAGREHVLPDVPGREGSPFDPVDGPLRRRGRRVRPVRLRSGRRAAPGRAEEAHSLRRLPAEVLPLGLGRDRPGRADRIADPGTAALL